jgi:EpsI family protein
MITRSLLILQVLILAGLASIFLIPRNPAIQPSAATLLLPASVGQWEGADQEISERELQVLAKDTDFARKVYTNAFGDQILVSIVMSGHDLDSSIHRPERCLPAQGWTIAQSQSVHLPIPSLPGGSMEVTRLHNMRPVQTGSGEVRTIYNLNYYWFVGHRAVSSSHFQRTFIDMRDRILRGYNQRWAYITVASTITEGLTRFGRSERETDAMLRDFIPSLFPLIYQVSERPGEATPTGR